MKIDHIGYFLHFLSINYDFTKKELCQELWIMSWEAVGAYPRARTWPFYIGMILACNNLRSFYHSCFHSYFTLCPYLHFFSWWSLLGLYVIYIQFVYNVNIIWICRFIFLDMSHGLTWRKFLDLSLFVSWDWSSDICLGWLF